MSPWIWVALGAIYLLGAAVAFRTMYLKEVERVYAFKIAQRDCAACKREKSQYSRWILEEYPGFAYCDDHRASRFGAHKVTGSLVLFITVMWPLVLVSIIGAKGSKALGHGIKKAVFPTGVKTPSKVEWERRQAEAQEAKKIKQLQADAEKLGLPFPTEDKKPAAIEAAPVKVTSRRSQSPSSSWEYSSVVYGSEDLMKKLPGSREHAAEISRLLKSLEKRETM